MFKNDDLPDFFKTLSPLEMTLLYHDWRVMGRRAQNPEVEDWFLWIILAGRGWGKTRTGAQWVHRMAWKNKRARIALVAHTAADGRGVMVEGESGLLGCAPPWFRPQYEPSKRLVTWPNGAQAQLFSAEEPDQLRGPQATHAWCDELAKWKNEETWDNLMFALRLGQRPQCVITTTPRSLPLLQQLVKRSDAIVSQGHTFENEQNLAPSFLQYMKERYEGTRLGRQELSAEILRDVAGALWSRDMLESCRIGHVDPASLRIVIAVDPATSHHAKSDETGIVVAGWDGKRGYVLQDASGRYSPEQWAQKVLSLYETHKADRIVAETNQGGAMVSQILRTHAPHLPIQTVHASKGKTARAEPVAALYEQGKIHHVGTFPTLEDQMCTFTGLGKSPDRLDALVWAITALAFQKSPQPRVGRV
jgi:phage terminase large subunit-like protein